MKIGTKKVVTYEVNEVKAKRFYDRIMSEKNPRVTLTQLFDLRQSSIFTDMRINYYRHNFVDANIDGKLVTVVSVE
jgi:hypothetical protein